MSECLNLIHKNNQDNYIEFIRHYGPALAGIRVWNQNKALKPVSELQLRNIDNFSLLSVLRPSVCRRSDVHQIYPALCKFPELTYRLAGSLCVCISNCVKQSTCDLNQQLLRKLASSSALEEELHQQL